MCLTCSLTLCAHWNRSVNSSTSAPMLMRQRLQLSLVCHWLTQSIDFLRAQCKVGHGEYSKEARLSYRFQQLRPYHNTELSLTCLAAQTTQGLLRLPRAGNQPNTSQVIKQHVYLNATHHQSATHWWSCRRHSIWALSSIRKWVGWRVWVVRPQHTSH